MCDTDGSRMGADGADVRMGTCEWMPTDGSGMGREDATRVEARGF